MLLGFVYETDREGSGHDVVPGRVALVIVCLKFRNGREVLPW